MDASFDPLHVVGFYTQPYHNIIHPDRVWRVPKYFLRRWGPYLTPARFWAVVAARQFAYWNEKANWFTVYDRRFAQEACLSTIHFRRIKTEMDRVNQPLSLFLGKEQLAENERYHVVNGQTKPKPTTYYVRLDDPFTPADAHHLTTWLQNHNQPRRAEAVASLLKAARDVPRKELLAPSLAPFLADRPAQFRYLSVLDVVGQVYGQDVARHGRVKEEAEALHSHLTGPDFFGKEYFRVTWLDILNPGPAFLITYLRSFCFYDETTGERRDEVSFTRPELAGNLGITTKTLVNWLEKIADSVPAQTLSPFMTLVKQQRISSNDVLYTYKIEMLEPLTANDLEPYRQQIAKIVMTGAGIPEGKNEDHETAPAVAAEGKNEDHEFLSAGKNECHGLLAPVEGQGKNEDHGIVRKEKMSTGGGKYDEGSGKKRWPFKYYQILYQSLSEEEVTPLLPAADWSSGWMIKNERALWPLAQVVCDNDFDKLLDLLEVDRAGPTRTRLAAGGLGIGEIVAWYLYAVCQQGLHRPPIHMVIARAQQGASPPQKYVRLATLSWELWRCYACLLILHPAARDLFRDAPEYGLWMEQYGRHHPDQLPFQVGEGVMAVMAAWQHGAAGDDAGDFEPVLLNAGGQPSLESDVPLGAQVTEMQALWLPVFEQLKVSMSLGTFNTWLKDAELVHVEADGAGDRQRWLVGVRNSYAVEWLTHRLNKAIIEPLASSIHRRSIVISYIEQ